MLIVFTIVLWILALIFILIATSKGFEGKNKGEGFWINFFNFFINDEVAFIFVIMAIVFTLINLLK